RCHRRQRLDALASARSKQSPAVVAQGLLPILMADNACKLLNIRLKTPFTLLRRLKIHRRHPLFDVRIVLIANSCWAFPLQGMRLCDSVRLMPYMLALNLEPALFVQAVNIAVVVASAFLGIGLWIAGLMSAPDFSLSVLAIAPALLGVQF